MRWMESLVERTGAGGFPTIQRLWAVDRQDQSTSRVGKREYLLRRGLNVLVALIALVLLFPLLLLIAVLVWLTSPGPILYTQIRVGLDRRVPVDAKQNQRRERDLGGLPFTIYKFRTMRGCRASEWRRVGPRAIPGSPPSAGSFGSTASMSYPS